MWLKVTHAFLSVPVTGVFSPCGSWFLVGSDVSKLFRYKNSCQFNRMYAVKRVRDVIDRHMWTHLTKQDLDTRVMSLDCLAAQFPKKVFEVKLLSRVFGDDDIMKVLTLSDHHVSAKRSLARVVEVSDSVYEFNSYSTTDPNESDYEDPDVDNVNEFKEPMFLDKYMDRYESDIMRLFKSMEKESPAEEDPPNKIFLSFGNGVPVEYLKAQ